MYTSYYNTFSVIFCNLCIHSCFQ